LFVLNLIVELLPYRRAGKNMVLASTRSAPCYAWNNTARVLGRRLRSLALRHSSMPGCKRRRSGWGGP